MQEKKDEEIPNSKNEEIPNKNYLSLLSKIFHLCPLTQNKFLPIIISTDNIPKLFYYLNNEKRESDEINKENTEKNNDFQDYTFQNRMDILKTLMDLFKANKSLINLFQNKCKSNSTNFLEPIIDLYLSEELIIDSDKSFLEQMIIFIINNVSMPKFFLEYIYQKLTEIPNPQSPIFIIFIEMELNNNNIFYI